MNKATYTIIALVIVSVMFVLVSSAYIVKETDQVIITQFGKPVGDPILSPGIHFKTPLIQQANFFDKRFLEWDGDPNQVPTKDKRFIWVDTYARWRIKDPLLQKRSG
jgi:membrane protease subunit HflC